jgi:hypothetical protein
VSRQAEPGTYIGRSHNTTDLFHGVQIRAQASVHREDLFIDDGSDWQAVEAVRKCLPQLDVVSTLAFVIEAIDAVDGRALVVASQDEEVLGVFDLVGKQEANRLEGLLAPVDIVAQEKVVGLRREPAIFEETQQVVILAMDVTTDLQRVDDSGQQTGNKESRQR